MIEVHEAVVMESEYRIQYRVVTTDDCGNMIDVCFHRPGKVGFLQLEMAQKIVAHLRTIDKEMGRMQSYDILPVVVADDHGMFEPTFMIESDAGDPTQDVLDAAEEAAPKKDPPQSN